MRYRNFYVDKNLFICSSNTTHLFLVLNAPRSCWDRITPEVSQQYWDQTSRIIGDLQSIYQWFSEFLMQQHIIYRHILFATKQIFYLQTKQPKGQYWEVHNTHLQPKNKSNRIAKSRAEKDVCPSDEQREQNVGPTLCQSLLYIKESTKLLGIHQPNYTYSWDKLCRANDWNINALREEGHADPEEWQRKYYSKADNN